MLRNTPVNQESVPEMSMPRKDHRYTAFISGSNDLLIAHGPTGLNGGCCAIVSRFQESIRKGEKRIRCHDAAVKIQA